MGARARSGPARQGVVEEDPVRGVLEKATSALFATSDAATWTFRARQGCTVQEGRRATALSLGFLPRRPSFTETLHGFCEDFYGI
jgi:hypothetical protein